MIKKLLFDLRLIFGLIIAHILIYFSFHDKVIFWYIFTGSILVLITYSMFQGDVDDESSFLKYFVFGLFSGLVLYGVIWLGYQLVSLFPLHIDRKIQTLYKWYGPSYFWQYLALILVAAPGEELFWRGFIQKRLMLYLKPAASILLGACLYASVNIYSGSFLLIITSLISGIAWGSLYFWKKSMPLVIVSHIVFDILIFIIFPF
ncbi:type II CAAX endopeptidase family protein [Neobacillus sp. OS1-32]|jgi:membrane protease YdiL (CAAX protease family)|uniref:CPBP family intramembrane glutamic endopeptidase n=1 Tax=Neobacillus TaxID=2675232 RepID=UPI001F38A45C|nr:MULTISPECIES: type II CAAX endopeptidase family protein [Neobacillus]WML31982.1 type II CAAX endopeptidase family protein [Neobacillus sp. OS1-32]